MKEPGLDCCHRDTDGTIQQKRSDTKNKNLTDPIPGFGPETTLGTIRKKSGKTSERDFRNGIKRKPTPTLGVLRWRLLNQDDVAVLDVVATNLFDLAGAGSGSGNPR